MASADDHRAIRIAFVCELASRLHAYGTTAQRLESAIVAIAQQLGLACQPWSNPTGLILSLGDLGAEAGADTVTRVIRLEPGTIDLGKLCQADAIADRVLAGTLDVRAGIAALEALDAPHRPGWQLVTALSFGLSSASVAGLLRSGWGDIAVSGVLGTMIGALHVLGHGRKRIAEILDALAALAATLVAVLLAAFVLPLSIKTVVLSSLIVLMPGMMLTNAFNELTSQHLVSGSARLAGAVTALAKLTFGTIVAQQIAALAGWQPMEGSGVPLPGWVEWLALISASLAMAVLFRARRRDYPVVMLATWIGYLITRGIGSLMPPDPNAFPMGVFLASTVVTALSNLYGRWFSQPGAVVRVPGILLLVPGSVGFRTMTAVFEREVMLGLDTATTLVLALFALGGGLLFGNLLVAARRSL